MFQRQTRKQGCRDPALITLPLGEKYVSWKRRDPLRICSVWLAPPAAGMLQRTMGLRGGQGAAGTLPEPPCPAAGDMSGTAFTLSPQTAPITLAQDDDLPSFWTSMSNWPHLPETGAKQPFPRHLISQLSSERS